MYYAYQPIVNIHTGVTLGFEALLRGFKESGYDSISEVFDKAYNAGNLLELELTLRNLAISTLYSRHELCSAKLFYNLDNRLFNDPGFHSSIFNPIKQRRIFKSNICFEISEKHEVNSYRDTHKMLEKCREDHFRIAIDDFGSGYSGLTMLYHSDPDFIKIDRFFIENINDDSRKKFFVANVVNLAHMMGISVIAEGIETIGEFFVCREIGCDYVQGYLIQKPESNLDNLKLRYEMVDKFIGRQTRKTEGDRDFIIREIEKLPAIPDTISTEKILEIFRKEQNTNSFPIVNHGNEPVGLLRETDLKKYVFSPYGISILQHKSSNEGIESLISKAPVMEISSPIEKILELYSLNQNLENVIITENGRYTGVLGASAILRILSEKKILIAQDQNPLTKLPGNSSINSYLAEVMKQNSCGHILVYFDLDNFKPFNDVYGFRQGDRIIRLFSEILQEHRMISKEFIGHIGGDDFFIGYSEKEHGRIGIMDEINSIVSRFANDVLPFYKEDARKKGYITSKSRNGRKTSFPFMTVSAAVICLFKTPKELTLEQLAEHIAALKIEAKKSPNHTALLDFNA